MAYREPTTLVLFVKPLLTIAAIAIVAAIVAPAYMHTGDHRRLGIVLNGLPKPIPGAVLKFRDRSHTVVAVLTADSYGEIHDNRLDDVRNGAVADGYVHYRMMGNTGGAGFIYYFSPPGPHTIFVHDASGKPMSRIHLVFADIQSGWDRGDAPVAITDQHGEAKFTAALAARSDIDCTNVAWQVGAVTTSPAATTVHDDITVVAPATVTGEVSGLGSAGFAGGSVLADRDARTEFRDFTSSSNLDSRGRFRLTHLKPGRYHFTVFPGQDSGLPQEDVAEATVTVAGGQTTGVTLQYR